MQFVRSGISIQLAGKDVEFKASIQACSADSIQSADIKHIQIKAALLGQVIGRSSGPVQLEEGRRMLDRSTVSMPGQVLQSGKIEEKEGLMLCMHAWFMLSMQRDVYDS